MTTVEGAVVGPGEAARTGKPVSSVWIALVLLIGVLGLLRMADGLWEAQSGFPGKGNFGQFGGQTYCVLGADGSCTFTTSPPGVGLKAGDTLWYDRALDGVRLLRIGEKVGITLRRDGKTEHRVVTVGPLANPIRPVIPANMVLWPLIGLVGLFLVVRSQGRLSVILLGAAFACFGWDGTWATLAVSAPAIYPIFFSIATTLMFAPPLLLLAFACAARLEAGGRPSRFWGMVQVIYAALASAVVVLNGWALFAKPLIDIRITVYLAYALITVGLVPALIVLTVAWRDSRGQDRTRFAFMLIAISLIGFGLYGAGAALDMKLGGLGMKPAWILTAVLSTMLGVGIFAYAVLRHRVLDLGFAVSRTLVYGAMSTLLLVAFGLIEWAVEHFLPREVREASWVIDAGVALAVFLTFHRVRDWIEHLVEGLFFRRWQEAEADLRRFVRDAAFATRPETLTQAFGAALGKYADGAPAAIYLLRENGFHRVDGPGDALDIDDPALLAMRAEPKAQISDTDGSALAAALIAPMVNRNEVIGLAVLGPKPSGAVYRPDEIELVGWATRQVGLDLHALKVEQLEAATVALRQENATLRSVIPQQA